VELLERRIEVNEYGEPKEVLDFLVQLTIHGLQRVENIFYTKGFSEVKKFLKLLKKDVPDFYDLEIPSAKE
jgi:hypothetical protein